MTRSWWTPSWALGRRVAVLTVACLSIAALPLEGQQERRRGERNREELMQRIRAQMARVTKERLGLTEEESQALSEIIQSYDLRRRELGREEAELRRSVEALVETRDADAEARASVVVERLQQLRMNEATMFAEEQEALAQVLSPLQILQLQSLREQMGRRVRSIRGDSPREGSRRRRGGRRGGGS